MKKVLALLLFIAVSGCSTVNIYDHQGGGYRRDGVRVINPCTQGGCYIQPGLSRATDVNADMVYLYP